ncbi:MAG TPA: hypothetical protein VKY35_08015 [Aliidiomarina sp.]|nr:hypothetical protein [Aliidiomarina sp.]
MKKYQCLVIVLLLLMTTACATTEHLPEPTAAKYSLEGLTQAEAERLFIRGRTQQHEVRRWFGQPSGFSKSGDYSYWNYTYSYQNQETKRSGLVILTVVFDNNLLVIDYDLQSNRYRHNDY